MSEAGKPPPEETPAQRREKRRAVTIGIVAGGVIGVTMGLIVISVYRGCTAETHSPPEAPIKALPPRPMKPTSTS